MITDTQINVPIDIVMCDPTPELWTRANAMLVDAFSLVSDAYSNKNGHIEINKRKTNRFITDYLNYRQSVVDVQAGYKPAHHPAIVFEPIHIGLSPLWRADRCVIPISETITPKIQQHPLIGTQINVLGFAQDCTIADIFKRDDMDGQCVEWARLEHERFGVLYRRTSSLLVKDAS